MDSWERRRRAACAEAQGKLNSIPAFAGIDYLDEDALTAALLIASEPERKAASSPLHLLFNDTWRPDRRSTRDLAALSRAWHAMLVGTSTPSRNDFVSFGMAESRLRTAVPRGLVDIWNARPQTVRDRITRWWWEQPQERGPELWLLWRELALRGAIPEPSSPNYLIGALGHLEGIVPHQFHDGRLAIASDAGLGALRSYLEDDPGIVELARKAVALEDDAAWVTAERRVLLVASGALAAEPIVADSLARLTRTLGRDAASARRQLIDLLAPEPSQLIAHLPAVTRVIATGQPADQAWAITRLAQVQKAGLLEPTADLADAVEVAAPQVAVEAAKKALIIAKAVGEAEEIRVAVAALGHSKLAVQQAAWRAIEQRRPDSLGDDVIAAIAASGPALLPAVAARAAAWSPANAEAMTPALAAPVGSPLTRTDVPVDLSEDEDLVAVVARLSTRSAESMDLDHLLALIAAKPSKERARERAELGRRVGRDEALGAPLAALPGHAADAVLAWIRGGVPPALPQVRAHRRVFGGSQLKYSSDRVSAGAAFATGWRAEHGFAHCAHVGVTGLWCARAWEAAFASVSGPGALLATPTHASGSVSAEAFAARLQSAAAGPLRYDAIALVLRLEPSCHDEKVLGAVRESDHPAALAALALWGTVPVAAVPAWLQPAVRSRAGSAGISDVRETQYPKMRTYQPSSYRDRGPVLEWHPAPSDLHVADPLGALAFQRGADGISVRLLEFATLDLRGLVDGGGAADFASPFLTAPWNTDEIAASLASWMVRDDSPARAWMPMDEWVSPLLRLPITPGPGWTALVAAALLHGNNAVRAAVVDVLGAGIGLEPAAVGSMVARLLAAGAPGAARAADALRDCTQVGAAGALAAAEILVEVVAGGTAQHRDGARLLETLEVALAASSLPVGLDRARQGLTDAATGTSRRAASAKRLLAL